MKCPNCGTENQDGAAFCIGCGKPLNAQNVNTQAGANTNDQQNFNQNVNQNFNSNAQGFAPNGQGFNPNNQGFTPNTQGFNPNAQGFASNGQGFNPNSQGFAPNQPNGMQMNPMGYTQSKPLDKDLILFFSSIAACLVCVILFFAAGNSCFGFMAVGKQYYYDNATNNLSDAYNLLDVKNSGYTSKKIYVDHFSAAKDELQYFDESSLKKDKFYGKPSGNKATVSVEFDKNSRDTGYDGMSISLVKKGNKFGIFPNWKVDPSERIAKNVTFYVPKAADFTIDGEAVDKKYITEEENSDGYTVYVIPEMFDFTYNVGCSLKGFSAEPVAETVADNAEIYLIYGSPDQDTMDSVCKMAYDDLTTVLNSCMSGKPFSDVSSRFTNGESANDAQLYDRLAGDLAPDSATKGLTGISFTNVKGDATYRAYSDTPVITVEVTADMNVSYNYSDWFSSAVTPQTEMDNYDARYYYVLQDGKWILDGESSMIMPYFYVYYGY